MRTGFPSDPLGLPHVHGGDFDAAGDALQLAESSSHAWGSLKASFRKGRFPPHTREGNREFSPVFSLC